MTQHSGKIYGRAASKETIEVSGHWGEFLQGRLGENGPVALVTLPMPGPVVRVTCQPGPAFGVHFAGGARTVSQAQIAGLIRDLTGGAAFGRWIVQSLMPPGSGSGTSTATLLGVARMLSRLAPDPLARHILAAEGASDPLMYPAPERLLWAPRQGRVLRRLPRVPRLEAVAGLQGPATRTDPQDLGFADISDLIPLWCSACENRDLPALGRLAHLSAERNIALRGGPPLAPLLEIGQKHGALGVAIAHTGSARALLFAPGAGDQTGAELAIRQAGLKSVRRFALGG